MFSKDRRRGIFLTMMRSLSGIAMKQNNIIKVPTIACVANYRGNIVENRHQVHAAIVDAYGKMFYTLGCICSILPVIICLSQRKSFMSKYKHSFTAKLQIRATLNIRSLRHSSRGQALFKPIQASEGSSGNKLQQMTYGVNAPPNLVKSADSSLNFTDTRAVSFCKSHRQLPAPYISYHAGRHVKDVVF